MKKRCPECKRKLELNKCNFRLCCDGFWRNKCRDCQNRRKRVRYKNIKKTQAKTLNAYRVVQKERVAAQIKKYKAVFRTLRRLGISPDAPANYVDTVLANANTLTRKIA
jgi:hypothetical protein